MRFFRKAIILIAVLAVAGFSYWYFEMKKAKEKKQKEEKEALLFENTGKDIVKITIRQEGKPEIVMEREKKGLEEKGEEQGKDKWIITSPVRAQGDSYEIDALINSIKEGKREEIVWENLEKMSEYKLDKPQYSLRFFYEGDTNPHGIDFGIESLDKKKVFLRVLGKDEILSAPIGFMNKLVKNLYDMRDKSLAYFSYDDVDEVSLLSTAGVFFLKREGDEWYLMPEKLKASQSRIEMYIGNITYGYFVEVEEEKAESSSMKKYGLDNTRLIVNFKLKDGSNYMFMVGDRTTQGNSEYFYATRSTDGMIFQVKAETVYGLVKTEFDMKDRRIFDFQEDEVSSVTLKKGENSFSLLRDEKEGWIFEDTGEKIGRGYKIDSIVRGITNAEYEVREPVKRGDKYWSETGIDDPAYYVALHFKDKRRPIDVRLTEKDEKTSMLWLTPDNGETAYLTSGYFLSNFPESREDLLEQ
jgi:hypothetical protein